MPKRRKGGDDSSLGGLTSGLAFLEPDSTANRGKPGLVRHAKYLVTAREECAQHPNIEKVRVAGYSLFAYVVPRSEVNTIKQLPGNNHACLYFLFYDPIYDYFHSPSTPESLEQLPKVYIGYGNRGAFSRLNDHHTNKGWWNVAVVILSGDDQQLRGGQVELLEASFIREVSWVGRYCLDNRKKMTQIEKLGFDRACQMEFRNAIRNILRQLNYVPLLTVCESINEELRQKAAITGKPVTRPLLALTLRDNSIIRRDRQGVPPDSLPQRD